MSTNNEIAVLFYKNKYHVFENLCADDRPLRPEYSNKFYRKFNNRCDALFYAHDLVYILSIMKYSIEYGVVEY